MTVDRIISLAAALSTLSKGYTIGTETTTSSYTQGKGHTHERRIEWNCYSMLDALYLFFVPRALFFQALESQRAVFWAGDVTQTLRIRLFLVGHVAKYPLAGRVSRLIFFFFFFFPLCYAMTVVRPAYGFVVFLGY